MSIVIKPQLCTSVRKVADIKGNPDDYLHELKYDGFRLTAYIYGNGDIELLSRTGKGQEGKLLHIEEELRELTTVSNGNVTIFDGEIVAMNTLDTDAYYIENDFSYVQSVMNSKPPRGMRIQEENSRYLQFVVFDLLYDDGTSILNKTTLERRILLETTYFALEDGEHIRFGSWEMGASQALHDCFVAKGLEGSILKHKDSKHVEGRNKQWYKIKYDPDVDVVIMGFTEGQGKYTGMAGAIVFGQFDEKGKLVERGQCSGMTDELREKLDESYIGRVMTIRHNGVMEGGVRFRHPRFKHLRSDKSATECTWNNG